MSGPYRCRNCAMPVYLGQDHSCFLRPDPAEASEPLQSAPHIYAGVDRAPRADAHGEAGTPPQTVELDERTIRAIADWLRANYGKECRSRVLDEFLPKKDPAKELVDMFHAAHPQPENGFHIHSAETVIRWLISEGKLK